MLRRTELKKHFLKVFGRDTICLDKYIPGKYYRPIANYLNLSEEQVFSNVIVVGNSLGDRPLDLEGMVTILQNNCYRTPSWITGVVLEKLDEMGDGNFNRGFEKIYQNAQAERDEYKIYRVGDGVELALKYQSISNLDKEVIPTIIVQFTQLKT